MTAPRRCAVYTRKSSDDGLEQEFNSLQAQREACEAYIRSQKGEGWRLVATPYDDAAYSGGTMDRPALQHLLADVAAGKVDVVVVYKVDRLTRSLGDFAKIVEIFDRRGVSFVSVTQAFNTTTSMGRLTLNVLLSFAQFEREVTGERIRDKIAASKAKGMWMGGMIPLGYDLAGRSLSINPAEAEIVRRIFERYLEVASVRHLAAELAHNGVRSKSWVTRDGKAKGGVVMRRGALFHILSSRIYVGEIVHKGLAYPGQHPAIVTSELFEAVAAKLASQASKARQGGRAAGCALTGLLFDSRGRLFSPSFAYGRHGRLYRYYILTSLQVGDPAPADAEIRRVPAGEVEQFVLALVRRLTSRTDLTSVHLFGLVRRVQLDAAETQIVLGADDMFPEQHVAISLAAIERRLMPNELAVLEPSGSEIRVVVAGRAFKRRGGTVALDGNAPANPTADAGLVAALRRAHEYLRELRASPLTNPSDVRAAVAPATQHDRLVGRLAFLSPSIQRDILRGRQPDKLKLRSFLKSRVPLSWCDQAEWLSTLGHVSRAETRPTTG